MLRDTCPFANLPEKRGAGYGQTITAAEMRRCRWVEPNIVCQVKFSEWTRDNRLRQPVFLGLREDKNPTEVVREEPRHADTLRSEREACLALHPAAGSVSRLAGLNFPVISS